MSQELEKKIVKLFRMISKRDQNDLLKENIRSFSPEITAEINKFLDVFYSMQAENELLKKKNSSMSKELNKIIADAASKGLAKGSKTMNAAVKESKKEEWEKIVDEMAHSINNDVHIAVRTLSRLQSDEQIKKALYHTKQIRELTNLTLHYLKRADLEISGEKTELSISDIVNQQIDTLKDSLSTLRLSTRDHLENLEKMDIPIHHEGTDTIRVTKEMAPAVSLIIKDLLRNAFKNSKENGPKINIQINESPGFVILNIINNRAISSEFSNWFNGISDTEPQIHKSTRVGLRVIRKWSDLLKIKAELVPDAVEDTTTAKLIFPIEVIYER